MTDEPKKETWEVIAEAVVISGDDFAASDKYAADAMSLHCELLHDQTDIMDAIGLLLQRLDEANGHLAKEAGLSEMQTKAVAGLASKVIEAEAENKRLREGLESIIGRCKPGAGAAVCVTTTTLVEIAKQTIS